MKTRIKQPCRGCQCRGLTLFWGMCVRCQNQQATATNSHARDLAILQRNLHSALREIAILQAMLGEAREEIREWQECYGSQFGR